MGVLHPCTTLCAHPYAISTLLICVMTRRLLSPPFSDLRRGLLYLLPIGEVLVLSRPMDSCRARVPAFSQPSVSIGKRATYVL